MINFEFRKRLKSLRQKRNLLQKELANALGLDRSTISAYECGKRFPEPLMFQKIANFFDVSLDYLSGRTDDPRPIRVLMGDAAEGDPELSEFWDAFLSKTDIRLAFRTLKDLDPQSLRKVIRVIKAISEEEGTYQPPKS